MAEATTSDSWADRQQAQAAGFDAIGPRYDEVFPHKEGQVRMVEQLLERVPAGARVLDLGCGTGVPTARQLVDGGCQVTGVDLSPVMLDQARRDDRGRVRRRGGGRAIVRTADARGAAGDPTFPACPTHLKAMMWEWIRMSYSCTTEIASSPISLK
jgi:SAM-dependent methyltransferase